MAPHRIDVHAHALTPRNTQALRDAGIDRIGGISVPDWSPSAALAFMDRYGVAVQMLSVFDPGVDFLDAHRATHLARAVNDDLAAIVAAGTRTRSAWPPGCTETS